MNRRKGIGLLPMPATRPDRLRLTAAQGTPRAGGPFLARTRCGGCAAGERLAGFSRSARRSAPAFPVPCAAVRLGREGPQGARQEADAFLDGTWMCRRETRPILTDFPPMDGWKAPSGVPLSLVIFL